jgi:hypothetical protein
MRRRSKLLLGMVALVVVLTFSSCSDLGPTLAPTPDVVVIGVNPMSIAVTDTTDVTVVVRLCSRNNADARINFNREIFFAPGSNFTDTLLAGTPQAMYFRMTGGDTDSIAFTYSKNALQGLRGFMDGLNLGAMDSRMYLTGASEVEEEHTFTATYDFSYVN